MREYYGEKNQEGVRGMEHALGVFLDGVDWRLVHCCHPPGGSSHWNEALEIDRQHMPHCECRSSLDA